MLGIVPFSFPSLRLNSLSCLMNFIRLIRCLELSLANDKIIYEFIKWSNLYGGGIVAWTLLKTLS